MLCLQVGSTSADLQPDERDPEVELVLSENDYTLKMFPYKFKAVSTPTGHSTAHHSICSAQAMPALQPVFELLAVTTVVHAAHLAHGARDSSRRGPVSADKGVVCCAVCCAVLSGVHGDPAW